MKWTLSILISCALLCGCSCQGSEDASEQAKAEPSAKASEGGEEAKPGAAPDTGAAKVGQPAPDFSLIDTEGQTHQLSELNGKIVVLEWYNPDCSFVRSAHERGSLKDLAQMHEEAGVIWLAVNSSAQGQVGHGLKRNRDAKEELGIGHPVLLDPNGEVRGLYGATTTPQMFVVSRDGLLAYSGAIDNFPGGQVSPGESPREYVTAVINDLTNELEVKVPSTQPYGCPVND
ncbi:MAG: redoxin domain-containing protein [Myxococcota bacterium]|nr:redoxin domain-containing protein [Myxococcota bacterium]MEE2778968.1 redoxin domain-containing protein [Myxococcota bacterium]